MICGQFDMGLTSFDAFLARLQAQDVILGQFESILRVFGAPANTGRCHWPIQLHPTRVWHVCKFRTLTLTKFTRFDVYSARQRIMLALRTHSNTKHYKADDISMAKQHRHIELIPRARLCNNTCSISFLFAIYIVFFATLITDQEITASTLRHGAP